jgi:hypothetical protein
MQDFPVHGVAAPTRASGRGLRRLAAEDKGPSNWSRGVRSITGWSASSARAYQIQTNNATVGIRGTDLDPSSPKVDDSSPERDRVC